MQRHEWPAVLGLSAFSMLAVGCAMYIMSSGTLAASLVAGAVLVLAVGQMAALLVQWMRNAGSNERLAVLTDVQRGQGETVETLRARIDRLEQIAADSPAQQTDHMLGELRVLKDSVQALAQSMRGEAVKPREDFRAEPQPQARPQAEKPQAASPERLELLLEPVVELSTGATAHYRALLNMVNGEGEEVTHAALMETAANSGVRPSLDLHLLTLALPVLRRLRIKHPGMRMFVGTSGQMLNSRSDMARVMAAIEIEPDAARGIVFDIAHGELAALTPAGVESMAQLARAGVTMALSDVSVSGLDLASLRQLGVRFLDIRAQDFDSGYGLSPAWAQFAQFARAMQFQMIAGNVLNSSEAATAGRVARFGYGAFFALPRRVKPDAAQPREAFTQAYTRAA
ncbi:EAL domain-containing protein [Aestuariivirga sp.]|uniref:EAL domain-containing protein n=1 Tax=Aestuariivirga sp. TaxID=2650926 RepID=UPI0039E4810C